MESGFPLLNCLLQNTLRSLCTCPDSSNSPKWVYAVFWRILPRNYPPPKWDYGGGALDRAKGDKRNWILVWEDGFCDFYECERAGSGYIEGRFGADVFFKLSHEVYNYGEGLVGKVAASNGHKWVFRDSPSENESSFLSSWNVSIDPQPRTWEFHFNSGIQTIAIISVREGMIQLGSFDKIAEDLNLVISIQRKFSYFQSIPGIYGIQRPYLPLQHPYSIKPNDSHPMIEPMDASFQFDDKRRLAGKKRLYCGEGAAESPIKSIDLGYNSPQSSVAGPPLIWSIPPLLPTMSYSLGSLLSKLPSVVPSYNAMDAINTTPLLNINNNNDTKTTNPGDIQTRGIKVESPCVLEAAQEGKPNSLNPNLGLEDEVEMELGFGASREGASGQDPN